IFQQKTVPEIIESVFSGLGIHDFEFKGLRSGYVKRDFCVQYRESDFEFVSRLMEEEGIFYYFRHAPDRHSLVMCDDISAYSTIADCDVHFADPDGKGHLGDQLTRWEHRLDFQSGRWTQTDYNPATPTADLMAVEHSLVNLAGNAQLERFDYPGRHVEASEGHARTRVRMQELEAAHDRVFGASTYPSFTPSGRFLVKTHRTPGEVGKRYVLTRVEYAASLGDSYKADLGNEQTPFTNRFVAIPEDVVFRPERKTPQPIVEGPQTAIIVGPEGEEIYTNENGEVKVQFHWDRYGKSNERSSCWIRVSQVHAGQGWGTMDLPRIGEEVIVDFLEGDPDRPMITGRVYNAEAMPPFELPAGKTRRGNTTKTYRGQGSNEMSMDDTPGQEQIRVSAQYNMDTNVNNNQSTKVGVDRTTEIGNNDKLIVGNDASESVGNDKKTDVGNNLKIDVGKSLKVTAGSSITLKCGASQIYMNQAGVITITGTIITTAAASNASVMAPMTQVVGGAMLTTSGGINLMKGSVCKVAAAGLASMSGSKVDVVSKCETKIKGAKITLN
ncbi:MAG: type VI secretion system tip protein TssI/VgrG, partial [Planctomycetota bacterium]